MILDECCSVKIYGIWSFFSVYDAVALSDKHTKKYVSLVLQPCFTGIFPVKQREISCMRGTK